MPIEPGNGYKLLMAIFAGPLAAIILAHQAGGSMKIDYQANVLRIHAETIKTYGMKPEELAISLVLVLPENRKSDVFHVNGDFNMYPASVVKMIYAGFFINLLDAKKVNRTPELDRAMRDMLFESSNDATGLILDAVTETTGGPELPPKELEAWMNKRQAVNRWLVKKGYQGQNACQKTWNEGPYGREKQGYGPNMELRNSLDANACVRMMAELALHEVASPSSCEWVLSFMRRNVDEKGEEAGGQTKGFLGEAFPRQWEWYSKAGWAYQVRHDVAYVKPKAGPSFILCVFTDHHGSNTKILPDVAKRIADCIGARNEQ